MIQNAEVSRHDLVLQNGARGNINLKHVIKYLTFKTRLSYLIAKSNATFF